MMGYDWAGGGSWFWRLGYETASSTTMLKLDPCVGTKKPALPAGFEVQVAGADTRI